MIDIFKETGTDLKPLDKGESHKPPSRRIDSSNSKRAIVNFVNRKHSAMFLWGNVKAFRERV